MTWIQRYQHNLIGLGRAAIPIEMAKRLINQPTPTTTKENDDGKVDGR